MRVTDLSLIRFLLESDRVWCAYAIGDLRPDLVDHCEWLVADPPTALVLVYGGFDVPIVFLTGDPHGLASLIVQVSEPHVLVQARPEAIDAIAFRYHVAAPRAMWRMALAPRHVVAPPRAEITALAMSDLAALRALYAGGLARGEWPDFFHDEMVEQGLFRGVREGRDIVAAAGTHLVSASEAVCAVGNVYTRHDRRGLGYGSALTRAVCHAARSMEIETVVLSVGRDNPALRMYEGVGFRRHCQFVEGWATLRSSESF